MYKSNRFLAAATITVASFGVLAPRADATHQSAEVIIEWNQLLQQNIGGPPFSQVRTYAMMHIAMADAVVAIEGDYRPYRARVWAPRGASAEAAAAQAARDVLVVLIPAGQTTFDTALGARLANDLTGASRKRGVRRQEGRGRDSRLASERRFCRRKSATSDVPGFHTVWHLEADRVRTGTILATRRRGAVRSAHAYTVPADYAAATRECGVR